MAAGYWPRATKTRRRGVGCRDVVADREKAMHRKIMAVLLAVAFGLTASGAIAQSFPSRPVTLIVPWPAGGTTDLVMRALATATEKHLGQSVTIENRPGAAGPDRDPPRPPRHARPHPDGGDREPRRLHRRPDPDHGVPRALHEPH